MGEGVQLHSFVNISASLEWVAYTMPWLLYPLGKRCGTLSTEGWVGFGASLEGYGESRHHRVSKPRPSSP